MITDLAHTAFAVNDIDAALGFYAKLGLHESFRLHHEDGRLMLVYLHISGDRFLELFPNGPTPASDRVHSFRHICLATDNLKQTIADLEAAGIVIERPYKVGLDHNFQAWISDPDGNAIELMQLVENGPQRRISRGESSGF